MASGVSDANDKLREQERVNGDPPAAFVPGEADTVRGHLRDALQALHRLELYEVAAQGSDLTRAREEVTAAVAIVEQVHHEAALHAFSFARHVEAVL